MVLGPSHGKRHPRFRMGFIFAFRWRSRRRQRARRRPSGASRRRKPARGARVLLDYHSETSAARAARSAVRASPLRAAAPPRPPLPGFWFACSRTTHGRLQVSRRSRGGNRNDAPHGVVAREHGTRVAGRRPGGGFSVHAPRPALARGYTCPISSSRLVSPAYASGWSGKAARSHARAAPRGLERREGGINQEEAHKAPSVEERAAAAGARRERDRDRGALHLRSLGPFFVEDTREKNAMLLFSLLLSTSWSCWPWRPNTSWSRRSRPPRRCLCASPCSVKMTGRKGRKGRHATTPPPRRHRHHPRGEATPPRRARPTTHEPRLSDK